MILDNLRYSQTVERVYNYLRIHHALILNVTASSLLAATFSESTHVCRGALLVALYFKAPILLCMLMGDLERHGLLLRTGHAILHRHTGCRQAIELSTVQCSETRSTHYRSLLCARSDSYLGSRRHAGKRRSFCDTTKHRVVRLLDEPNRRTKTV